MEEIRVLEKDLEEELVRGQEEDLPRGLEEEMIEGLRLRGEDIRTRMQIDKKVKVQVQKGEYN